MNPLSYFFAYFETNHFTFYLLIFFLALTSIKYLRIPLPKTAFLLIGVIALGVLLRIGWIGLSTYTPKTAWDSGPMLESDLANIHAVELTKGIWFEDADGKPMARRPIGYPLVVGLFYKIFGTKAVVLYVLNLMLFVAGAWFLYLLGQHIFSERIGLLATFFYSIYPTSIYSIKLVTDEHLFIPLWFLGLVFLVKEIKGRPVRCPLFWYGLIFGVATMTRTHSIFMSFVVAGVYFLMRMSWKKILAGFFVITLLTGLIALPWAVRNYKIWQAPVFYTANDFFVYRAVNSSATPEGNGHIPQKGEEGYSEELEKAAQSGNEGLYHSLCGREIRRWILTHPKQFLLMGTCRAIYFMGWNRAGGVWPLWFQFSEGSFDPARPMPQRLKDFFEETAYGAYYFLLFCFLFSLIFLIRRWRTLSRPTQISILAIGACFVFWLVEHMVIYPDRKYRYPLEPLMIILASTFLDFLLFEFQWKRPVDP